MKLQIKTTHFWHLYLWNEKSYKNGSPTIGKLKVLLFKQYLKHFCSFIPSGVMGVQIRQWYLILIDNSYEFVFKTKYKTPHTPEMKSTTEISCLSFESYNSDVSNGWLMKDIRITLPAKWLDILEALNFVWCLQNWAKSLEWKELHKWFAYR